jgi:hypothetical protein
MSLSAYAQHTVVVNPDGTHSIAIQTGVSSTIVNPNGAYSTVITSGSTTTIINPDGTLSTGIQTGSITTIVNPNGTHSTVIENGDDITIANPKGKKTRQALKSTGKKSVPKNDARTSELALDPSAILFVVDGCIWMSPDFTYEKLGPLDVEAVLDRFVEAMPFISKEDIDSFTVIKSEEWAKRSIYFQVPKDNILISTKKESQIKTFVLNGKPTKRRRGIGLGVLLDEELLKQQIQKKWRIKADKIAGVTIEGKTISITTK